MVDSTAERAAMTDEDYMRLAIELAKAGNGWTNPNPLVGAVIVKDGRIIGQGCHEVHGDLHAERNALKSCTEDPSGATAYVTLEPCNHHGHQPPCVDALIEAGIARVVVGSRDPNPLVHGQGNARLRAAGIQVEEDFLRDEADALNPIFFRYMTDKLPYVVAKWAMTADGHIAAHTGDSQWVSNEDSRAEVHELRHRLAAIMVGVGTVLADDPSLTCRRANGAMGKNPLRVVCDTNLRTPLDCKLVKTACDVPTLIATCSEDADKIAALKAAGVEVVVLPMVDGRLSLSEVMHELAARNIDSVLLEGGAGLNVSAFEAGLVNELVIYMAPKIIGGADSPSPVGGKGLDLMADAYQLDAPIVTLVGSDVKLEYGINGSPLITLYPSDKEAFPMKANMQKSAKEVL